MTESAQNRTIRIGGASGFWGDASLATAQLLGDGALDYLVYDYLAEITMSIMARARAADPALGYAVDFVTAALSSSRAVGEDLVGVGEVLEHPPHHRRRSLPQLG